MSTRRTTRGSVAFAALAFGCVGLAAGCSSTGPRPPESAIRKGELGNGGFTFTCDDSVVCARYANTAQDFPKAVALGSTFRLGFVPNPGTQIDVSLTRNSVDFSAEDRQRGYAIDAVGRQWISRGPEGLAAVKPGYGTVVAKNGLGQLIDYAVVRIAAPDTIVVYDGTFTGSGSPQRLTDVKLKVGEQRKLRALGRAKGEDLAGAIRFEWYVVDENVIQIDRSTEGTVTLTGRAAGKTSMSTQGGAMSTNTTLEVTP